MKSCHLFVIMLLLSSPILASEFAIDRFNFENKQGREIHFIKKDGKLVNVGENRKKTAEESAEAFVFDPLFYQRLVKQAQSVYQHDNVMADEKTVWTAGDFAIMTISPQRATFKIMNTSHINITFSLPDKRLEEQQLNIQNPGPQKAQPKAWLFGDRVMLMASVLSGGIYTKVTSLWFNPDLKPSHISIVLKPDTDNISRNYRDDDDCGELICFAGSTPKAECGWRDSCKEFLELDGQL